MAKTYEIPMKYKNWSIVVNGEKVVALVEVTQMYETLIENEK